MKIPRTKPHEKRDKIQMLTIIGPPQVTEGIISCHSRHHPPEHKLGSQNFA